MALGLFPILFAESVCYNCSFAGRSVLQQVSVQYLLKCGNISRWQADELNNSCIFSLLRTKGKKTLRFLIAVSCNTNWKKLQMLLNWKCDCLFCIIWQTVVLNCNVHALYAVNVTWTAEHYLATAYTVSVYLLCVCFPIFMNILCAKSSCNNYRSSQACLRSICHDFHSNSLVYRVQGIKW